LAGLFLWVIPVKKPGLKKQLSRQVITLFLPGIWYHKKARPLLTGLCLG
jgi:hypothetical protein